MRPGAMRRIGWPITLAVLCAGAARAREPDSAAERRTEITSRRLTYDYQAGRAVFEDHVHAIDPDFELWADRMTVSFSEPGVLQEMLAEGTVRMQQDDVMAYADKAHYRAEEGLMVLEGGPPRVHRGRDVVTAVRITFWREPRRLRAEPDATLWIYPGESE